MFKATAFSGGSFTFNVFVQVPLHWLWQATVWSAKAPFRALGWLFHQMNILVNGQMPEFETARESEIYRRIRRRFGAPLEYGKRRRDEKTGTPEVRQLWGEERIFQRRRQSTGCRLF